MWVVMTLNNGTWASLPNFGIGNIFSKSFFKISIHVKTLGFVSPKVTESNPRIKILFAFLFLLV